MIAKQEMTHKEPHKKDQTQKYSIKREQHQTMNKTVDASEWAANLAKQKKTHL